MLGQINREIPTEFTEIIERSIYSIWSQAMAIDKEISCEFTAHEMEKVYILNHIWFL